MSWWDRLEILIPLPHDCHNSMIPPRESPAPPPRVETVESSTLFSATVDAKSRFFADKKSKPLWGTTVCGGGGTSTELCRYTLGHLRMCYGGKGDTLTWFGRWLSRSPTKLIIVSIRDLVFFISGKSEPRSLRTESYYTHINFTPTDIPDW